MSNINSENNKTYFGDLDLDRDLESPRLLPDDRLRSLDLDLDLDLERDLRRSRDLDLERPLDRDRERERDLERDASRGTINSSFRPWTSYPSYFSIALSISVRLANSTTLIRKINIHSFEIYVLKQSKN